MLDFLSPSQSQAKATLLGLQAQRNVPSGWYYANHPAGFGQSYRPISPHERDRIVSEARLKLGMAIAGRAAAARDAEIKRLRVENAVLTAQLETLLAPAAPEGWIVTEGPKELLP